MGLKRGVGVCVTGIDFVCVYEYVLVCLSMCVSAQMFV